MEKRETPQERSPVLGERAGRLALVLARLLPYRVGRALSTCMGHLAARLVPRLRRIVEGNLKAVLPQASPRERRRTAVRVLVHAMRSYYELLHAPSLSAQQLVQMAQMEGPGWECFQEAHRQGRGVILVSTHQSSFDLIGLSLAARGFPLHIFVLPEQTDSLAVLHEKRLEMGTQALPVGPRTLRTALRALREGGTLVVFGDRPVKGQGTEVEFFGRPTVLPDAHVRLAQRCEAAILGSFPYHADDGYHLRMVPLELARSGDDQADLRENVQRVAHMIEEPIRAHPEQWHLLLPLWE
ncbi:MAG: hypothetical protein JXA37_08835 [Chloroflexia bacterium]|nr:hypothetical protein [Chloroflexia bacterium]